MENDDLIDVLEQEENEIEEKIKILKKELSDVKQINQYSSSNQPQNPQISCLNLEIKRNQQGESQNNHKKKNKNKSLQIDQNQLRQQSQEEMKFTNDKKLQQSQFKKQSKKSQQHLKSVSSSPTKINEASPIKAEDLNELIESQKKYIESINQLDEIDFQNMNEQGVIPYPIYLPPPPQLLVQQQQYVQQLEIRYKNQIEELISQMQKLQSQLQLQEERELQGQNQYQAEILQLNQKHNLQINELKLQINLMIAERQNLLQQLNITGTSQIVQKQQKEVLQTAVEKLMAEKTNLQKQLESDESNFKKEEQVLQQDKKEQEKKIKNYYEENLTLTTQVETLKTEIQQLNRQLEVQRQEFKESKLKIKKLENELQLAQNNVQDEQHRTKQLQQENQMLKRENFMLTEQIEHLKSKNLSIQ